VQDVIVCGVDGSAHSEVALRVAAKLAERLEARLLLAQVVQSGNLPYGDAGFMPAGMPPAPAEVQEHVRAGEGLLAEMAERAGLKGAERRVVAGFAAERLADIADEEKAAFIVVGSRGRGSFKAAVLGSVSTSLIGAARCPVLVVPAGARE